MAVVDIEMASWIVCVVLKYTQACTFRGCVHWTRYTHSSYDALKMIAVAATNLQCERHTAQSWNTKCNASKQARYSLVSLYVLILSSTDYIFEDSRILLTIVPFFVSFFSPLSIPIPFQLVCSMHFLEDSDRKRHATSVRWKTQSAHQKQQIKRKYFVDKTIENKLPMPRYCFLSCVILSLFLHIVFFI